MPKMSTPYNFSRGEGAVAISVFVSSDLNKRLMTLCNITEMNKTSICRYLLQRGVTEMERKLVELANKAEDKSND